MCPVSLFINYCWFRESRSERTLPADVSTEGTIYSSPINNPPPPWGTVTPKQSRGRGESFPSDTEQRVPFKRLLSVNGRQLSFDSDSEMKCIERRYQSQSAGVHRKAFQPLASSVLITKLASRCRACISAWFWNSLWKEICYICHTALVFLNVLKGIVHPKMEMMSLLTHPHVFQACMTYFIFCEKYVCNAHNKINGVQFSFETNWLKKKKDYMDKNRWNVVQKL